MKISYYSIHIARWTYNPMIIMNTKAVAIIAAVIVVAAGAAAAVVLTQNDDNNSEQKLGWYA